MPLSRAALGALRDHAAVFRRLAPSSPYVFKQLRPNRSARPGDRLESLYVAFKRAARAIGIPRLRPHDLRHSFVTGKLAAGVPVQLVSRCVDTRTWPPCCGTRTLSPSICGLWRTTGRKWNERVGDDLRSTSGRHRAR